MKRVLVGFLVLLVAAAAVVKIFIFEIPVIRGGDMAPVIQSGDRLLVNKLERTPARGALVLIEHPQLTGRLLVRRVVGMPGETIQVKKEVVHIAGAPVRQRQLRRTVIDAVVDGKNQRLKVWLVEEKLDGATYRILNDPTIRSADKKELKLAADQVFVMADNRDLANDSRNFGPVPTSKIRGLVTHRLTAGEGSLPVQTERPGFSALR